MQDDSEQRAKDKQDADKRELAKSAWASRDAVVAKSTELTVQFGQQAIRGVGVINAAAVAALLGMVSANAKFLKQATEQIECTLIVLIAGVILATVAFGMAYVAQYCYTSDRNDHSKSIGHPYIVAGTQNWGHRGTIAHRFTVLLVVLAYVCFFVGAIGLVRLAKLLATTTAG
jgi:hypothetical protein